MNEPQNPFAEPIAPSRPALAKSAGLIGLVAVAAIAAAIFAGLAWHRQTQRLEVAQRELQQAREANARSQSEAINSREKLAADESRLSELKEKLANHQSRVAALETELASNQVKIATLETANETANQTRKGLEDQMRAELQSKDVTISRLQGKLTVNILDRIMFDSGEAVLKPGGEAVLRKIAAILEQHPTLKIHVIGHTDNVPIRAGSRSRFPTNWELSAARALAAVRFLSEKTGVDPRRLGAVGYGEFRPIADNSTPEGRAQNRRIAITILADELAGADTVAGPKPAISPDAPSVGSQSGSSATDAP